MIMAAIIAFRYAGLSFICIGCGIVLSIPLVKNIGMVKSYIEIYEDHIEGVSIPKKIFGGLNEIYTFSLNYEEISSVSSKKNIVVLNYSGGIYEVQAKNVEQKVTNLINKQKKLSFSST